MQPTAARASLAQDKAASVNGDPMRRTETLR
jgi:hypothetical protein